MIIYRAMCEEEYLNTIKYKKPDFSLKRFKWFSPSLEFIITRVKDGSFNNSRHCKNRYKYIMSFEIYQLLMTNYNEIQVDRRSNIKIDLINEVILL